MRTAAHGKRSAFASLVAAWLLCGSALAEADSRARSETDPPDLRRGEQLWAKCRTCHTYEKNGRNLVGPRLYGVFGRRSGTVPDYRYSPAMRAANVTWTAETLDRYLAATQDFIPGNKMYGGLAIAEDRTDLLAWLKTVTGAGKP